MQGYFWGVGKVGGVLTHATQRRGRGCGCRAASHSSPRPAAPRPSWSAQLKRWAVLLPRASGMRCASLLIRAQVGFLTLCRAVRSEAGSSGQRVCEFGSYWGLCFVGGRVGGKQVNDVGGKLTFVISFRSLPPPTSPFAGITGSEAPIRKYRFLPLGQ